jgi:hypothetical protein
LEACRAILGNGNLGINSKVEGGFAEKPSWLSGMHLNLESLQREK